MRGRFFVGCDGGHSTVRERLGLQLEGITYRLRAALADVSFNADDGWHSPRLSTSGVLCVGIRIDEQSPGGDTRGLWRLILPYLADETPLLDQRLERAVHQLFGPRGYEVAWKSGFSLRQRICPRFVAGNVVLAGDAAHLNSPVGG